MSAKPFMPLWIGDLLADTRRLTMTEFGCYVALLLTQWSEGTPIPENRLHIVCGMTRQKFAPIKKVLENYFGFDDSGAWFNRRIERELVDFHSKAIERTSKARKAAAARWGTQGDTSNGDA